MKRLVYIFAFFLLFTMPSSADIDDGLDYEFINNAFSDPNPTTNKQFEDVMQKLETPREGLFTKLFKFFDSDKIKYDEAFKKRYEMPGNQPKRLKDFPDEKPTVLISIDSRDSYGNNVGAGYYQVNMDNVEGKYKLHLAQGANKDIATLYARKIREDEKAPAVAYARAETTNNGYVRVIYANLDVTLEGYLKIKQDNNNGFEPLY